MTGSAARRARRQIKRSGIAKLERVVIDGAAVTAAVATGINLVELVAYHVAAALEALDLGGGDVLAHTVVTIGEHPDYPGDLMIEAKAANLKANAVNLTPSGSVAYVPAFDDIAIPPADEADLDDSDDGLLAGP